MDLFDICHFDSIGTAILCDGHIIYDIYKLWIVCRHYKCNINCSIPNTYQVRLSIKCFWNAFSIFLSASDSCSFGKGFYFHCCCYNRHRAMATCLILMFGRLGAVGGSNFVGLLLDVNCELIFYLYGGLILSMCDDRWFFWFDYLTFCAPTAHPHQLFIEYNRFNCFSFFSLLFLLRIFCIACAIVCCFLNTNPMEKSGLHIDHTKATKCESWIEIHSDVRPESVLCALCSAINKGKQNKI